MRVSFIDVVVVGSLITLLGVGYALPLTNVHFSEKLILKRASANAILAQLNFEYSEPVTNDDHIQFSPTMYALFVMNGVVRLDFSIAQGHWRNSLYGLTPEYGGAPGVYVVAQFNSTLQNVEQKWTTLVHQLNGLFCASFAIVADSMSAPLELAKRTYTDGTEHVHYGAFTGDNICTENAEAFRKLLPCQRSGLSQLLNNAQEIYDSLFYSTSISASLMNNVWSVTVQVNILKPIISKHPSVYNIFRQRINGHCSMADESSVLLETSPPHRIDLIKRDDNADTGDMNPSLNLTRSPFVPSLMKFSSFTRESHLLRGRFVSVITSTASTPIDAVFVHLLPWQLYIWHSTAAFECNGHPMTSELRFTPKTMRTSPTLIEMAVQIPPESVCSINYEFQKGFLRFYEYPPDSSSGIHVPGPILNIIAGQWSEKPIRLHAEPSLVLLPIPDFSMPFNVICFVCTIVAMFFQLMLTFTTKYMSTVEEPRLGLLAKLGAKFGSMLSIAKERALRILRRTSQA